MPEKQLNETCDKSKDTCAGDLKCCYDESETNSKNMKCLEKYDCVPNNTNLFIGGGATLLSSCCCYILLMGIMMMMMQSKK